MLIPGLELANMISEKDLRLLSAWLQIYGSSSCCASFISAVWRDLFTGLRKLILIRVYFKFCRRIATISYQVSGVCNYNEWKEQKNYTQRKIGK